ELRGALGRERQGGGSERLRHRARGRARRAAQRSPARGLRDERGAGERAGVPAQPQGGGGEPGRRALGALPEGGRGRGARLRELLALGWGAVRWGRGVAGGGAALRAEGAGGRAHHARVRERQPDRADARRARPAGGVRGLALQGARGRRKARVPRVLLQRRRQPDPHPRRVRGRPVRRDPRKGVARLRSGRALPRRVRDGDSPGARGREGCVPFGDAGREGAAGDRGVRHALVHGRHRTDPRQGSRPVRQLLQREEPLRVGGDRDHDLGARRVGARLRERGRALARLLEARRRQGQGPAQEGRLLHVHGPRRRLPPQQARARLRHVGGRARGRPRGLPAAHPGGAARARPAGGLLRGRACAARQARARGGAGQVQPAGRQRRDARRAFGRGGGGRGAVLLRAVLAPERDQLRPRACRKAVGREPRLLRAVRPRPHSEHLRAGGYRPGGDRGRPRRWAGPRGAATRAGASGLSEGDPERRGPARGAPDSDVPGDPRQPLPPVLHGPPRPRRRRGDARPQARSVRGHQDRSADGPRARRRRRPGEDV
ncbi:MAG: Arginyl-tRNA synthetase, partial [uncultured Rubrobacteraceae bacterium]